MSAEEMIVELQALRVKEAILGLACQQVMEILEPQVSDCDCDEQWIGEIYGKISLALSLVGRDPAKCENQAESQRKHQTLPTA